MKDISAYNFYVSLDSAHRVLRAKLKISFNKYKSPKRPTFDWSLLKSNNDPQRRYFVLVQNRYDALFNEEQSFTQLYENLISANDRTTKELLPKKKSEKERRSKKRIQTSCYPRISTARKKHTNSLPNISQ